MRNILRIMGINAADYSALPRPAPLSQPFTNYMLMQKSLIPASFLFIFCHCNGGSLNDGKSKEKVGTTTPDTAVLLPVVQSIPAPSFDTLLYDKTESLKSSSGTKSVVFNQRKTRLYALNLEGMSVYEFSQARGNLNRIFKFRKTPGTGWDYELEKPIPSYQEKPVEGFVSDSDSILWVSLHNSEGIVPIHLMSEARQRTPREATDKLVYLLDSNKVQRDSFYVPLIRTGKTPKIISGTSDDRYLLVSNWHSYSVSVLEKLPVYPYARLLKQVIVSSIPRGITIDEKAGKSYVAIMGGASISTIENTSWTKSNDIGVEANPRHILQDASSRLLISYNKIAKIGCVDPVSGKALFTARTASQPRTMALSSDKRFLFVTCYSGDRLMVFKIYEDRFVPVADMPCGGNPVGVEVFEDATTLQAWVCSYDTGMISVFKFNKK